jgi:hypothetical protein
MTTFLGEAARDLRCQCKTDPRSRLFPPLNNVLNLKMGTMAALDDEQIGYHAVAYPLCPPSGGKQYVQILSAV